MACKDILIVEDDRDIREITALVLEEEGYEVHQAENGSTALKFLIDQKVAPGCIILDLIMPTMDGRKFLEILSKEHPDDLCKIPIILATAKGPSIDEMSKLPCMIEKISKPFEISKLIDVVQKHCS